MRSVAVDIVTGFLGSGKTTLLSHVLAHGLKGKPVAVIMNEIGEIGIDGRVVTGLNYVEKMVELSSGCICCSIDDYRFDLAVQEIVETTKPHLIIIESTGLADPDPLIYRVKSVGLSLDAVITVVDAANVERFLHETEVAALQIEAADFLVINKLDLVGERALKRVKRRLARHNQRAEVFATIRGAMEAEVIFATGVALFRERAERQQGNHLANDGFASFLYRSGRRLHQDRFEQVLARLPADIVRAKGIVNFVDRDWQCLFSYTCGRHELSWLKLPDGGATESQGVFIGRNLERYEKDILAALAAAEEQQLAQTGGQYQTGVSE